MMMWRLRLSIGSGIKVGRRDSDVHLREVCCHFISTLKAIGIAVKVIIIGVYFCTVCCKLEDDTIKLTDKAGIC